MEREGKARLNNRDLKLNRDTKERGKNSKMKPMLNLYLVSVPGLCFFSKQSKANGPEKSVSREIN